MRTDGNNSKHGGGAGDGSESSATSNDYGPGRSGRGPDGTIPQAPGFEPVEELLDTLDLFECSDGFFPFSQASVDPVNHPAHYSNPNKKFETIDKIEDAVQFAPNPILGGLQWQVLKYMDRLWDKENPKQDAMKARWYLNRLIEKLED